MHAHIRTLYSWMSLRIVHQVPHTNIMYVYYTYIHTYIHTCTKTRTFYSWILQHIALPRKHRAFLTRAARRKAQSRRLCAIFQNIRHLPLLFSLVHPHGEVRQFEPMVFFECFGGSDLFLHACGGWKIQNFEVFF
jgi:hypothetical protein